MYDRLVTVPYIILVSCITTRDAAGSGVWMAIGHGRPGCLFLVSPVSIKDLSLVAILTSLKVPNT